jgi:Secretion system C-terminal sorting domain
VVLWPNPCTDRLVIQAEGSLGFVRVYNALGQSIGQWTTNANQFELATSKWPAGMYPIVTQRGRVMALRR